MALVIQVMSYRKCNRRVFLRAPVHHHFEQLGWPETRVIIRLWMLSAACTAAGIGLFYRDFLSLTEVLR